MLTEQFKSELNNRNNPCYVITKDLNIVYVNPAAVAFTPKAKPETMFLHVLCGRTAPCKDCPLNGTVDTSVIAVSKDALCSFANVKFTVASCDSSLIVSSWNEGKGDPVRNIAQINLDKALDNLNGLREAYDNVLEVFYQTGRDKPAVIMNHYRERDYHNLRIEVHGLKGTAYVIGAEHLGDFAKKLEFACKDIEADEDAGKVAAAKQCIDDELNDLIAEYVELLMKLSDIFGPYTNDNEISVPETPVNEDANNHLARALEFLECFDIEESQNHLKLAAELLEDEASKAYMNLIMSSLNDFNYDEATDKLRNWINP